MLKTLNIPGRHMALIWCVAACSGPTDLPRVVTNGDGFFGSPWPSDTRTRDGQPDMTGFPMRDEGGLVTDYADMIESLDGFGTNSPIYIPLDRAVDDLPTPRETQSFESPLMLIDIDPRSPRRGELTPLEVNQQTADTIWQRKHLLSVQPVWGFPLQPRTTYALVLHSDFVAVDDTWSTTSDWTDLDNTLLQLRSNPDHVAYAIQFTTQDPVAEMARFAARIQDDLTIPVLDQDLNRFSVDSNYEAYSNKE